MGKILMWITHLVTNLIIQYILVAMILWYYDTSAATYIIYTLLCIIFLFADYSMNSIIMRRINTNDKPLTWWLVHLSDLVFAIPSVSMVGVILFEIIITKHFGSPILNTISTVVLVLVINALLIFERTIQIRKKRIVPSNNDA